MLLNLAPPHNSTLPSAAMALYAGLGTFTRTCYGEGATPSVTTLASTSCYKDCNDVLFLLPLFVSSTSAVAFLTEPNALWNLRCSVLCTFQCSFWHPVFIQ